jgi:hypothetical protein
MFHLTEETRSNIIALLRENLNLSSDVSDEDLSVLVDSMIDVVKKQFGM